MKLRACLAAALMCSIPSAFGQTAPIEGVVARIQLASPFVQVGEPVWAVLSLENITDDAITLTVPGVTPDLPSPEMGLPLSHVFSGEKGSGIVLSSDTGRSWEIPQGYKPEDRAPIMTIAPRSVVGVRMDLAQYYRPLRGVGIFRLQWKPYNGLLTSDTVTVDVSPLKQAEIVTDFGRMTVQFYYEDAPATVANFIDLARSSFYTNLTFHRLEPGYMILGGDSRGDGTGIRPDGRRVPAEFNARPHKKGTLSMALADDDPDSASSQFFICYTRQKEWDGRYTVFGELVGQESFDTLDKLMSVPVDANGKPIQPVYMRAVRIIQAPYQPEFPHASK
jgi:cyclophilin family peptidyl-prolyl cis-trans isomerase